MLTNVQLVYMTVMLMLHVQILKDHLIVPVMLDTLVMVKHAKVCAVLYFFLPL